MFNDPDVDSARRWLRQTCNRSPVRHLLERGLDYLEAVERAGLCTNATDGDDLYEFLSDPNASAARTRSFCQPTL